MNRPFQPPQFVTRHTDCIDCDGRGGTAGVQCFSGSPYGEPTWDDCDTCEGTGEVEASCDYCGVEAPLTTALICEQCDREDFLVPVRSTVGTGLWL